VPETLVEQSKTRNGHGYGTKIGKSKSACHEQIEIACIYFEECSCIGLLPCQRMAYIPQLKLNLIKQVWSLFLNKVRFKFALIFVTGIYAQISPNYQFLSA
jgi:hypothetical protein